MQKGVLANPNYSKAAHLSQEIIKEASLDKNQFQSIVETWAEGTSLKNLMILMMKSS